MHDNTDDVVSVSVIMPIRNEERYIAASLGAVLTQEYPAALVEVLIADGMSTDNTLQLIYALPGAERVRIFTNPHYWQAPALNMLIHEARNDVIIRVDGHTIIASDYISQCVKALKEWNADEVGGAITPTGTTLLGTAIAAACRSAFAVPGAFHTGHKAQRVDTVYMGAWPRDVLDKLGGYQEHLHANEDYDLNYRLRQSGGVIYFSPTIRSTYYGRQSLPALAKQYIRYGRSKTAMLRLHPTSLRMRQVVAPTFVAACLLGGIGALLNPIIAWGWGAMLLTYMCLCFLFTLHTMRTAERKAAWFIPGVFLVIHVSWGLGFWIGFFEGPMKITPKSASTTSPS